MTTQPATTDALQQAFEQIAAKQSRMPAIDAPDGLLSYAELAAWSDAIAAGLSRDGEGTVVGLLFEPSVAFCAAVVGCMKAGVIAQLIDPEGLDPTESLAICLTDTRGLSRARRLSARTEVLTRPKSVIQPIPRAESEAKAAEEAMRASRPLHRLVTSGSSGSPTTVTISREGLLLHAQEMNATYAYSSGRHHANLTRHTTAAGIHGFWRVLLRGGCFMCFDLHQERFDSILERLLKAGPATLQGVPTVLESLASAAGNTCLDSVKQIIFGGEALRPALLARTARLLPPDCRISYNYSSSETMQISVYSAPLAETLKLERIPCGRPLPSREISLLGPDDSPVAQGEIGEIVVTAPLMAHSLAGGTSAERFSSHPDRPGVSIYRTRDLGCWNPEGQLEYIGRADRQLKIHGVRVDPGSVEQVLEGIPGLQHAVVLGLSNGEQAIELIACVVRSATLEDEDIVTALQKTLPSAWIPSRLVDLTEIPILPSGKVDLRRIESLARRRPETAAKGRNESDLEAWLRDLWAQVLGRAVPPEAGTFITQGGDSLRAALLVNELGRAGYSGLTPLWVARHPTLAAQAAALSAGTQVPVPESASAAGTELLLADILQQIGWV